MPSYLFILVLKNRRTKELYQTNVSEFCEINWQHCSGTLFNSFNLLDLGLQLTD